MARFDRYLLSQFIAMFGFFALVLILILWINEAVRMFDRLVGGGQPLWVFAEFATLAMPRVAEAVLPIAVFAAAVHVANRLVGESEITVVQAAGRSPARLAATALAFGVLAGLFLSVLSHVLVPASMSRLQGRETEVSSSVAAKFLEGGRFLHPASGVTFYIREITPSGELLDILLSDRRDPGDSVVYTSAKAYLVQDDERTSLVMAGGMAQYLRGSDSGLLTARFDDFAYDVTPLLEEAAAKRDSVEFTGTPELLADPEGAMARTGASLAELRHEIHSRFAAALIPPLAAAIGFTALMLGSFSRFGALWQILFAFAAIALVKVAERAASGAALADAAAWPALYLPAALGGAMLIATLRLAARPRLFGTRTLRRLKARLRARLRRAA